LRFFESGATAVPREDRVYRHVFDQETTRSVDWELILLHPPPGAQAYAFTVEAVYHRPDGSVLGRSTLEGRLEGDSTITWSTSSFGGFGTGRTGGWPLGAYRVDLLVDGGLIASSGFVVEDRPNAEPASFLKLRDGLPWATGRLTYESRRDLKTLSILTRNHPDLAATVAAFPWVVEGVTDQTRGALEYLALLADQDPVLATSLAGLPWVADDITNPETTALKYLTLLSGRDGPLAHTVAALPWAKNRVSSQEGTALEYLYFFTTESPAIAHIVAGYPWFADGITTAELGALEDLRDLATQDVLLSQSLASRNWAINGINGDERFALWSLKHLARKDPSLAAQIAGHPWLSDDITSHEAWALNYLKDLQALDATLGKTVAGLSWFADGIDEQGRLTLEILADIAKLDTALAKALAVLPWLEFDLTSDEQLALRHLSDLLIQDPILAKEVADMAFLTSSFEVHDRDALSSLLYLGVNYPNVLALMAKQDWFVDGLDDLEAAFVIVVGTPPEPYPAPVDFLGLMRNRQEGSKTIRLPLAGEVRLNWIHNKPEAIGTEAQTLLDKREAALDQLEDAIRAMEELTGLPFPRGEVISLLALPRELNLGSEAGYLDLNRGTHILVNPDLMVPGETNRALFHEIAHYYWGAGEAPLWFREGASDFLTSYVRDRTYGGSPRVDVSPELAFGLKSCDAMQIPGIDKLIDKLAADGYAAHRQASYFYCNYNRGENLFIELYDLLGPGPFRAAWRELHQLAVQQARPVNENEIYQAFLRQATGATVDAFKGLYGRLHGGDFPE